MIIKLTKQVLDALQLARNKPINKNSVDLECAGMAEAEQAQIVAWMAYTNDIEPLFCTKSSKE